MQQAIQMLIQLQELDDTARNLQSTKEKLNRELAETERAAGKEKHTLENTAEESLSFRKALDKRELDLKGIEGKISKLEIQLNAVKSNKEYAAFQHEIMGLRADKSRIEDEIIAMLDQIDTQKDNLRELTRRAEAAAQKAEEHKESVATALEDADARIKRLRHEREEVLAQIPAEFLSSYERLLHRTGGKALAPCRNFVCGACRMSLTANTVNLLLGGNTLVYCHSCGRILYMPEDEAAQGGVGAGRH